MPRVDVDRLLALIALRRQHDRLGRVLDIEELAGRASRAPDGDLGRPARRRVHALLDQRRDHVRRARVEVVAGAIQVHGHEEDGVEAVLPAVGLRLHEQHLLGQPVGRVGLLGVPAPEVVLAEGHRRELGIGADGADDDELGDAGEPGLLHELHAHHHVVVEEEPRVLAVGADAAHHPRQVDDQLGAGVLQHADDVGLLPEIVVAAPRDEGSRTALTDERVHHERAQEAGASRDHDALAVPEARHDRHERAKARQRARSASTIICTSSGKRTLGDQPSFCRALVASPSSRSTSAGRFSVGSTTTYSCQSSSA